MWCVNWVVGLTDAVSTQEFPSKEECLDFLSGYGLGGIFLASSYLWWIVSPTGEVHVS